MATVPTREARLTPRITPDPGPESGWLGGKDYFAADRELAEKMLAVHPVSAQMARENRQFLGRAVSYVAARGVRQFIDIGAGLPTVVNTHDIARRVDPAARVAYVDHDPVVISHARSLLARSPGVIAIPGDMHEPGKILADGAFAQAVAPGSYMIISCGSGDRSEGEIFTSAYTAARIYIHSAAEIRSFFCGLELVPPGVTPVPEWPGYDEEPGGEARTATFVRGVGQKMGA